MYKTIFTRVIRRQGNDGNLYVTIPVYEERKNQIEEGDMVEVRVKKVELKSKKTKI